MLLYYMITRDARKNRKKFSTEENFQHLFTLARHAAAVPIIHRAKHHTVHSTLNVLTDISLVNLYQPVVFTFTSPFVPNLCIIFGQAKLVISSLLDTFLLSLPQTSYLSSSINIQSLT